MAFDSGQLHNCAVCRVPCPGLDHPKRDGTKSTMRMALGENNAKRTQPRDGQERAKRASREMERQDERKRE